MRHIPLSDTDHLQSEAMAQMLNVPNSDPMNHPYMVAESISDLGEHDLHD